MKNLYDITRWQLAWLWFFIVIAWFKFLSTSCVGLKLCSRLVHTPISDWAIVVIPFLIIFYTMGWVSKLKKEIKNGNS